MHPSQPTLLIFQHWKGYNLLSVENLTKISAAQDAKTCCFSSDHHWKAYNLTLITFCICLSWIKMYDSMIMVLICFYFAQILKKTVNTLNNSSAIKNLFKKMACSHLSQVHQFGKDLFFTTLFKGHSFYKIKFLFK